MRIGLFTDSYLPQVSGVATSIETLANQLTSMGHNVFIFTTTDPQVDPENDEKNVIRLRSIPLISLAERRIVLKGVVAAYQVAQTYHLDIIHTQTEFGVGMLGKLVARQLKIPVIHTLHTKYEDYVHYIAKGRIIRPGMVKYIIKNYLHGVDGVIAPSDIVMDTINQYGVDGRLYKAYQSKAKHYLELNLNFTTNKDTRGSRVIYSSYSSNRFATSIFKSLMNTTGLVPYGRNTASNIAGVVAASRFSGLDAYPSIREAGGRILVAGTISDLAIEQNSSFNKEERKGIQSLSLELFFISNSLDTSVYQTQFDALVDNIAKGYLKALGME